MRRKRILGLATIGLVFSLALAGCTGSSKESTASKKHWGRLPSNNKYIWSKWKGISGNFWK